VTLFARKGRGFGKCFGGYGTLVFREHARRRERKGKGIILFGKYLYLGQNGLEHVQRYCAAIGLHVICIYIY